MLFPRELLFFLTGNIVLLLICWDEADKFLSTVHLKSGTLGRIACYILLVCGFQLLILASIGATLISSLVKGKGRR